MEAPRLCRWAHGAGAGPCTDTAGPCGFAPEDTSDVNVGFSLCAATWLNRGPGSDCRVGVALAPRGGGVPAHRAAIGGECPGGVAARAAEGERGGGGR